MDRREFHTTELHSYHEIIVFNQGDIKLIYNDTEYPITPPSLVIIPQATPHKFIIPLSKSYERYIFNFYESDIPTILSNNPVQNLTIIDRIPDTVVQMLNYAKDFADAHLQQVEFDFALKSILSLLLTDLSQTSQNNLRILSKPNKTPVSRALEYIGTNFTKNITTDEVVEYLGVSKATFARQFKQTTGTSLHKFIAEKRLIYANKLILSGITPTEACYSCGYTDYSAFYRAYINYFNVSPSNTTSIPDMT